MERRRAEWSFTPELPSIAAAGGAVAHALSGLPGRSVDAVVLLTSELVTNAILHGAGHVAVHLTWDDRQVRLEVVDQSPTWPVLRAFDVDAPSGRGLLLVEALSAGWGVEPNEPGKTVWFTIDV